MEYVKKLKEVVNSIYKLRDKDVMDIDNINVAKRPSVSIQTLELASPSRSSKSKYSAPLSSRAQLNLVQGLSSDDLDERSDDDEEDSDFGHEFGYDHSTDSEPDFERKLERMAYGSRTRC